MTTLTLEEQKKLKDKVSDNLNAHSYWNPKVTGDSWERSQALAVLEAYAKSIDFNEKNLNKLEEVIAINDRKMFKITKALRTGDLDPIARELIGGK